MKDNRNLTIAISQCAFTLALAACACLGMMNISQDLESKALAVIDKQGTIEASEPSTPENAMDALQPKDEKEDDDQEQHSGKAEENLKDGVYYGTGKGYGGNIRVKLTVEGGKIKALDIVDSSSETPSFFQRAASVAQKIVSAGTADVDGVSGATLSSNGIKAAAADAIRQAGGKGSVKLKPAAKTSSPKGKTKKKAYKKPSGGWKDGTYTGSARGYGGQVSVKVTIKGGKIKSVQATGKSETASYWKRAQAVRGRIVKAQNPRVDAVSGATYSSNGIINAVINALNKAVKSGGAKEQTISTSKESYEIEIGSTASLKAKAKTKLSYKSTNSGVAAVDGSGNVTAVSAGTAKIKITAKKSSKYKKAERTVTVTVVKKKQTISFSGYSSGQAVEFKESDAGKTISLGAASSAGTQLTYSSDNPGAATVSADGTITIAGAGNARITVTAPETDEYKSASASITVKVKKEDEEPQVISGVFSGSGDGYGGLVYADVTIEDGKITNIAVKGPNETDKYWFKAKKITSKMISGQTWDVDAVSGCTLSSNGIRNAVKQALEQAGLI